MNRLKVAFLMLAMAPVSSACTGFAVYSEEAWYGMNFDYPSEYEIRWNTHSGEEGGFLYMSFLEDFWIPTVGMNEHGVFATLQYQCPMIEGVACPGEGEMFVYQLFTEALHHCSSIEGVEAVLESADLVNLADLTLHALIADTSGRALIAETGSEGDCITMIDDDWLVMTNFRCGDFPQARPEEVEGVGAERYRRALNYIGDHHEGFGLTEAMATLETAVEPDGAWSTRASMVYRPSERAVYVSIDRDFGHIWRISMDDGTIGTFSGFEDERVQVVGEDGITLTAMREWL